MNKEPLATLYPDPQLCPYPQLVTAEGPLSGPYYCLCPHMQDELTLWDSCPLLPYRINYTKGFFLFLLWRKHRLSLPVW